MEKDKKKSNDFTNYHGSIGDVMNNVSQCIESLTQAIVQSDEYQEYNSAKEAIKGNVELEIKLNEYRMKNLQLQTKSNAEDYFDDLDMLEQEFASFKKDPRVMAFLSAELRLCKMVQEINVSIAKLVDLELKF